jgi:hypothetical protein
MMSQAAYKAEKAIGHDDNAETVQDVTNPSNDGGKYGDESEKMIALAWQGKNTVEMVEVAKPKILEPRDGELVLLLLLVREYCVWEG